MIVNFFNFKINIIILHLRDYFIISKVIPTCYNLYVSDFQLISLDINNYL